uniref:Fibrous sheath CABYR-binding protein-like n=1 Tax=Mesocestoides corti TaxID=53468 RepID=A0A5K3FHU8_MESCO
MRLILWWSLVLLLGYIGYTNSEDIQDVESVTVAPTAKGDEVSAPEPTAEEEATTVAEDEPLKSEPVSVAVEVKDEIPTPEVVAVAVNETTQESEIDMYEIEVPPEVLQTAEPVEEIQEVKVDEISTSEAPVEEKETTPPQASTDEPLESKPVSAAVEVKGNQSRAESSARAVAMKAARSEGVELKGEGAAPEAPSGGGCAPRWPHLCFTAGTLLAAQRLLHL